MTVIDSSTPTHVCPKCQQEKPLTREFWFSSSKSRCRSCVNIARRESERLKAKQRRHSNREAHNLYMRQWKAANPEKRQEQRRKYKEKQGKSYHPRGTQRPQRPQRPSEIENSYNRLAKQNAYQAFEWWFSKKTDEEVKRWYEATATPWKNPRLTEGQKWSVRYQFDLDFRTAEKSRLYAKKMQRKHGIAMKDDGTASSSLIFDAKTCLYCGAKFSDTCKPTLDHLIPLVKGGSHSAANLAVCCLSCNSSKGSRDFFDFVETLADVYKTKALRYWHKLRGVSPKQQAFI